MGKTSTAQKTLTTAPPANRAAREGGRILISDAAAPVAVDFSAFPHGSILSSTSAATTNQALAPNLNQSPEPPPIDIVSVSSKKGTELVTDKKAWTEKGFDPQEAEPLVNKYYNPEAFKHIPPNAILVPMPSTSGRNVLPELLDKRIAKDTGAKRFDPRIAESIARKEAKKKTSFGKNLQTP